MTFGRSKNVARTPSPDPINAWIDTAPVLTSPSRSPRKVATDTPSRRTRGQTPGPPQKHSLPEHSHPLLERQKRAIMESLQHPPELEEVDLYGEDYPPTNTTAYEQLNDLLMGTVTRGEGNSCMLIGPSGSGKTQVRRP